MNIYLIKNKYPVLFTVIKVTVILAALVFFAGLSYRVITGINLPEYITGLDPSFAWALDDIASSHRFCWGEDIIFTYGPYAYLLLGKYHRENILLITLIIAQIAFIIFLGLKNKWNLLKLSGLTVLLLFLSLFSGSEWKFNIFAWFVILMFEILVLLVYQKKLFSSEKLTVLSVLLLFIPFSGIENRFNLLLFFLYCAIWLLRTDSLMLPVTVFTGLLSAFALFLKLNSGVIALGLMFFLGLYFFIFCRKQFVKFTLVILTPYILFTLCSIVFYFKNVHNFYKWLELSFEMARGYSTAVVIEGPVIQLILAGIMILSYICFFLVPLKTIATQKIDVLKQVVFPLIGLPLLFFSFKHGFVRQDGHVLSFFTTVPLSAGLIYFLNNKLTVKKDFICFCCIIIISGISLADYCWNEGVVKFVSRMSANEATIKLPDLAEDIRLHENKTKGLEPDILPDEWNKLIGNNCIQILPWEFAYAAANNWTGWMPNPVLQSLATFTKKLDEYSAASFDKERMPSFILLEFKAGDNRNMMLDTPATMNAIVPNYHIVKNDNSRLLLQKNIGYRKLTFEPIQGNSYLFNEAMPLPLSDEPVFAQITIQPSLAGKLITTFFRGNPCNIRIRYQNGEEQFYRIITDTLKTPVLISAVPQNFEQMEQFFLGIQDDAFKVVEIEFTGSALFYKNNIHVEWLSLKID